MWWDSICMQSASYPMPTQLERSYFLFVFLFLSQIYRALHAKRISYDVGGLRKQYIHVGKKLAQLALSSESLLNVSTVTVWISYQSFLVLCRLMSGIMERKYFTFMLSPTPKDTYWQNDLWGDKKITSFHHILAVVFIPLWSHCQKLHRNWKQKQPIYIYLIIELLS